MPLTWLQQEQLEKPIILKKFWEERVLQPKDAEQRIHSINGIKNHFLLALPKPGMGDTEWEDYLNQAWDNGNGSAFASEEAFYQFFEHISSVKAVGVFEGFISRPEPSKEAITVAEYEIETIKQYTQDKGLTVSGMVGSVTTGIHSCCSDNYSTSDVFTTQSISKIFTGVLAVRLLEESVISTQDLTNPPIQMAPSTTAALAGHPQILKRLGETTLHQALTHYAGLGVGEGAPFGDYYGNYIQAVEMARKSGVSTPEIHSIEDFIPLIPNQTAAAGTVGSDNWHYSNSGIILAALSLEHLYNERRDKTLEPEPLSFDEIMKKYVTGPTAANMSCFQASPQGLTVRQGAANSIAAHMVGSPGGGYFSTAEDLGRFAHWMHDKCQDPEFVKLIGQYGQEFCPQPQTKTIEHTGDGPSSSGFFSLNWETGNLAIILNDQRAFAASEVGREIQDHILFQKPVPAVTNHDSASSEASPIIDMPRPTSAEIEERMALGEVPGVSIAYLDPNKANSIEAVVIGKTDVRAAKPNVDVEENTVFGAASLSKPVFSYLVLKLIADKELSTTDGKPFDLDTPISEMFSIDDFYTNALKKEISRAFSEEVKGITARMVLSHTTGLVMNGAPRLDFEPGTQYAYANVGLCCLQKAIETHTGQSLEALAQEHVFEPIGMSDSSFLPPIKENETPPKEETRQAQANAANSLHTTASDYARFAEAWMKEKDCGFVKTSVVPTAENQLNAISSRYILTETGELFYYNKTKASVQEIPLDKTQLANLQQRFAAVTEDKSIDKLSNQDLAEITAITGHTNPLQEAFRPAISLMHDQWAIDMGVTEEDRQHLAWGLGLGLQLDDNGEVVTAFHSGDMNQWRGWVAMDVNAKTAVVYFANGNDTLNNSGHGYGHVLADTIVSPEVELSHGLNWFFKKFGVSRGIESDWKAKEEAETARIGQYVSEHLSTPPVTAIPQVLMDEAVDKAKLATVESGLQGDFIEAGQAGMSLQDRMAHHRVPDVSMAIIDGDTITPVAYHLSTSTEQTASVETRFQAGSISKVVTAVIALKLWQDGKLFLDQDVNSQLNDWKVPHNTQNADEIVTLRHLLSHTAGLTMSGFPGYPTSTDPAAIPTNLQILNAPATLAIISQWPPNAEEMKTQAPGYFLVKDAQPIALYRVLSEEMHDERDYQQLDFNPKLLEQLPVLEAEAATHPDKKVILSQQQMRTLITTGEYDPAVEKPVATQSIAIEPYALPGTEFRYSGGGTQIIQQLIVEAMEDKNTGQRKTFAEIADEIVFKPLGMTNSTFELIWPDSELANSIVHGHQEDGNPVEGGWPMHPESAAAGLWTTPTDLAKLVIGIQNNTILFKETTAEMLEHQVDNSPCGLGPFLNLNAHEFSHGGSTVGYCSSCVGFSSGVRKGAIIMTNSNNGHALIDELNHSVAAAYDWPSRQRTTLTAQPINAAILHSLEGVYHFPAPEGLIEVSLSQKQGRFFLTFPDPNPDSEQVAHELKQASDTSFFVKMRSGQIVPLHINDQNQLELFGRLITKKQTEPAIANTAVRIDSIATQDSTRTMMEQLRGKSSVQDKQQVSKEQRELRSNKESDDDSTEARESITRESPDDNTDHSDAEESSQNQTQELDTPLPITPKSWK